MNKKIIYPSLFMLGLFLGFVAIDAGHVLFNRYWIHNIYTMYFVVGAATGMLFNYFIKGEVERKKECN